MGGMKPVQDGTGPDVLNSTYMQLTTADAAKEATLIASMRSKRKVLTWKDLVLAGIFQALECSDPAELYTRLHDARLVLESWEEELAERVEQSWVQTHAAVPSRKSTRAKTTTTRTGLRAPRKTAP